MTGRRAMCMPATGYRGSRGSTTSPRSRRSTGRSTSTALCPPCSASTRRGSSCPCTSGPGQSSGHVWQGRFKAFPIQQDEHLLTVVRYVERNALRAGLVERAEDWPWSSLRAGDSGPALDPGPVPRGADWLEFVNAPMTEAEVAAIRLSLRRDRPYGAGSWATETATLLGLEYSLRPRGHQPRPPTASR